MFNFDFSVHGFWWTPLASSVQLIDNIGLTEKCQNWKYCGNKIHLHLGCPWGKL